jgi:hypothetical protein
VDAAWGRTLVRVTEACLASAETGEIVRMEG